MGFLLRVDKAGEAHIRSPKDNKTKDRDDEGGKFSLYRCSKVRKKLNDDPYVLRTTTYISESNM